MKNQFAFKPSPQGEAPRGTALPVSVVDRVQKKRTIHREISPSAKSKILTASSSEEVFFAIRLPKGEPTVVNGLNDRLIKSELVGSMQKG